MVYDMVDAGSKASYTKTSFHGSGLLSHAHSWTLRWPKVGFSFDGWRQVFSLGGAGAAVRTSPVSKQLTNQTLLIALPGGGGNYFKTNRWGMHCLPEHFLSPERVKKHKNRGVKYCCREIVEKLVFSVYFLFIFSFIG